MTGYLRPKYEFSDINNDVYRYNPRFQDKHMHKIDLNPPKTVVREKKTELHCGKGLHRLAEIALNVRTNLIKQKNTKEISETRRESKLTTLDP